MEAAPNLIVRGFLTFCNVGQFDIIAPACCLAIDKHFTDITKIRIRRVAEETAVISINISDVVQIRLFIIGI